MSSLVRSGKNYQAIAVAVSWARSKRFSQAACQGQRVGRCSRHRRAWLAIRAGTWMSWVRIANHARKWRLHLPTAWPWQTAWESLFGPAHKTATAIA